MTASALSELQLPTGGPVPTQINEATNMLLPPDMAANRLRHFPEEVYDTSPESHLSRLMMVLLGDVGAGQLRKALLRSRLQQTINGTHFYALDKFYGALFDFRRSVGELLSLNPQTQVTNDWQAEHAKDSSYRSRIQQFSKALSYGATPTGMELVAEAVLSIDCDIYESYIQADAGTRTYAEIEADYATYLEMEGVGYGELEGEGLPVLAGNERREFIVRPKRQITQAEAYDLTRVLNKVKPADARFRIDWEGIVVNEPLTLNGIAADSEYWEVVNLIPDPSGPPIEPPLPPFSKHQGDAWTYNGDIAGVSAFSLATPESSPAIAPTQRIYFPDQSFQDYPPADTILPLRSVLAGRIVSDGILVSGPYGGYRPSTTGTLTSGTGVSTTIEIPGLLKVIAYFFADWMPLEMVLLWLRDNPVDPTEFTASRHFWVSPLRAQADTTAEYVEVRLTEPKLVNNIVFETSRYPHIASVEYLDSHTGLWVPTYVLPTTDSFPTAHSAMERAFAASVIAGRSVGHPEHPHTASAHWVSHNIKIPAVTTDRVRFKMVRCPGIAPYERQGNETYFKYPHTPVPYTLAIRKATIGYKVESYDDLLPFKNPDPIASATNFVGQAVRFAGRHQPATGLLEDETWRSEPQPFNYAVVNLFMDARDDEDEPSTIDRFYIDPTHPGCHITIYWSNDEGEPDYEAADGGVSFFAGIAWNPVPRDYVAQKGYLRLPPTRAKWFKFEFTNLVAEPYEVFIPIRRVVRIFSPSTVEATRMAATGVGPEARPVGLTSAITMTPDHQYPDAVETLAVETASRREDSPTSAFYVRDPHGAMALREQSWAYGFQPFTQGSEAPRFTRYERHIYQEVELFTTSKVGYFCGLRALVPYRLDHEAGDDTEIYTDNLDDFRNIEPGMTWSFDPGAMSSGGSDDVVAISRPMGSLHTVRAIQFATSQSDPIAMIADDEFQDPALADSTWSDPDEWHKVGDAQVLYRPNETTVRIVRHVTVPLTALAHVPGLDQPFPYPVLASRTLSLDDEAAAAETFGGLASGLYLYSEAGRVHAAARVFVETALTSPLLLQIVEDDGTILAEASATGRPGDRIEWYVGWTIPEPAPMDRSIRVQVIQEGKSDDVWRVDTLSLFDDGVVWDFSVNGGVEWFPAHDIRNNVYGILSFPQAGNQLVWRARGVRENVSVSGIRIRPLYSGIRNSRQDGVHRGPNVSTFDHDPPINLDPWFTQWDKPIPRSWFYAYKGLPLLPVAGAPNNNEFSRHYNRTATENLGGISDEATTFVMQGRYASEALDTLSPTTDVATRPGSVFSRTASDSLPVPTDVALQSVTPEEPGIVAPPVHPPE